MVEVRVGWWQPPAECERIGAESSWDPRRFAVPADYMEAAVRQLAEAGERMAMSGTDVTVVDSNRQSAEEEPTAASSMEAPPAGRRTWAPARRWLRLGLVGALLGAFATPLATADAWAGAAPSSPPTLVARVPGIGTSNVSYHARVSIYFDEEVQGVSGSTFVRG